MKKFGSLDWVAMILSIIGGLNWGLVGLFHWNLVEAILGMNIVTDIVYILVGLSALYLLITIGSLGRHGSMAKPEMNAGM